MAADKLFLGNIITMEAGRPAQEAMTVKDGKVQFVGTRETAEALCDENTEVVDFGDSYIYPGIIESHCHPDMAGVRIKLQADLTPGQSMAEYVEIMDAFIKANPGADEYRGAGWCERECKPTAAMLDAICPDVPVALNSVDGHSQWLNTPALAKYNIDQACIDFWGTDIIHVDENGAPTGYISEGPTTEISTAATYTDEQRDAAFLAWQDFAFEQGLTAVMHAGVRDSTCQVYDRLIKAGKWKLRTYGVFMIDEREEDYVARVKHATELAAKYNNEYFQIIGIKVFMDGVVEAHTAWMCEGYEDDPECTGVKRMRDLERVTELFTAATKEDMLVHCHTIGDGAVKFAVDCIEASQKQTGDFTARHALCHLQVVRPEDVQRMADLRIMPVVAPLWVPKHKVYYPQAIQGIGEQRASRMYPIKAFADLGAAVTFHTDYPVSTDMSVPRSIYTAVTRTAPEMGEEGIHWPEQCISRQQAMEALTTVAAFSIKQEDKLGMLACGYVANMVVFDKDFLADSLDDVADAKLQATIIDGETVYCA